MVEGLTVGILAAFVAAAGWRLGATYRGLCCLLIAAALGICGRLAGVEEFVLLAVALGVLLAAGPIVLWHRAERAVGLLNVEFRPTSHEVAVGSPASLIVVISNAGVRTCAPMRLEVPDRSWQLSRPGLRSRAEEADSFTKMSDLARRRNGWRNRISGAARVPALGPSEKAEIAFTLPTSKRGVVSLGSLRLWCLDPFELFAYEMVVPTETSVVIVPDAAAPSGLMGGSLQPAGRIEWAPPATGESSGGQGFDFSGLRPYVPGDRLRLLHWPTMARTGELFVRDFEGSGTDAVTLVMDDRAGIVGAEAFEAIVATTAGIGVESARLGLGVELRTPGGVFLDLQSGPTLSRSLLRVLATLDPVNAKVGRSASRGLHGRGDDHSAEKNRIVISTAQAVGSLPDLLRRSSTVVIV